MKKKREFDFLKERKLQISLLKMKVTVLLLLVCVLQSVAGAYSQTTKYDISMTSGKLENVFKLIEQKGEYTFLYSIEDIDQISSVNVNVKQADLKEVLDICLANTKLTYEISGHLVIIRAKDEKPEDKMVVIKGVVKDKKGEPLPGVTIVEKGTKVGVATGVDGKFTFTVAKHDGIILVFSFVGMKTREITWTGQKELNVVMEEESQDMDEVVVTGYMNVNRRDMVGSYTTLKADDVMMPAYSSIDQMLQGQVPGMIVMNTSTRVGTSPKIQIRGTSTLLGNQDPLWVVDGIIQEDPLEIDANSAMITDLETILGNQISWLNPQDIETITVLKDASATAIYGSKASNGVIVVTTKKGKADRLSINYSGNFSVGTRPNYGQFNLMNSKERIQLSEEAFNDGVFYLEEPYKQPYTYEGAMRMYLAGEISQDEFLDRKEQLEKVNTNWLKLLTRSAFSHSHNLSVSGGTSKFNYVASVGFNQADGQEIGNSSKRMSGRVSVGMQLHPKMRATVNINGSVTTNKGFANGVNPLGYATSTSRAIEAYDENGEYSFYRKKASYRYNTNTESLGYNILNEIANSGSTSETSHLAASLDFSWDITDWLKYQFTGGYNRSMNTSSVYRSERTFAVANEYRGYDFNTVEPGSPEFKAALLPFGGDLFTTDAVQDSYNIQNKLLISKTFNEDHRLNALIGIEVRSAKNESIGNTVWGYVPDRGEKIMKPTTIDKLEPIGAAKPTNLGIFDVLYSGRWNKTNKTDNFFSVFATLAYSLKNRYVLNVNVRNDASNRFGQDVNNRVDPTYSFGFSWRVSSEPFMENISRFIHNLNFKATYGIQGNALVKLSPELILKQGGVATTYNQYQATILRIPNPELSWERTRTWNFGLELGLFNAVNVNIDYYRRRSNAVVTQDLSYEFGVKSMEVNGGIIYNKGLEVVVNFTPVNRKNFGVSVSINSSKNWNTTGKPIENVTINNYLSGTSNMVLKKGYPLGAMWSFSYAGLNPEDGRPMFNLMDVPEEERDSKIDPTTFLVYSGQKDPYFTGGLNLGIRYKSLNLNSSFALLLGGKKRLPSPYANFTGGTKLPNPETNVNKDVAKRWKKPGDEKVTDIPALIKGLNYSFTRPDGQPQDYIAAWEQSDYMVVNASFLRCRQISLAWNVERRLCQKIGVNSISLNATVNNIFVIASKRFNGFDPEVDNSVMPRTFSAGINIGF